MDKDIEIIEGYFPDYSDTVWVDYEEDDEIIMDENGIVRKVDE